MKEVEKQNIPILSPRYGISCSHHPDAYRAPRSILISLFFAPHPVRIFRRTQIDAPRRGRRPRRPVVRSFHVSGEEYSALRARVTFGRSGPTTFFSMPPAAIFLSTAKEIWKRTPPRTNGFWISLVRFQPRYKKVPHRIACTPIPAAASTHRAETRRSVIVQRDCCVHIGGFPNTGAAR